MGGLGFGCTCSKRVATASSMQRRGAPFLCTPGLSLSLFSEHAHPARSFSAYFLRLWPTASPAGCRLVLPYNLGDLQKKGAHGCLLGKLWRYRMLEEFARPLRCPILDAPFRSAGPGFRLLDLPPVLAEVSLEVRRAQRQKLLVAMLSQPA